jgi:hypothetical protein
MVTRPSPRFRANRVLAGRGQRKSLCPSSESEATRGIYPADGATFSGQPQVTASASSAAPRDDSAGGKTRAEAQGTQRKQGESHRPKMTHQIMCVQYITTWHETCTGSARRAAVLPFWQVRCCAESISDNLVVGGVAGLRRQVPRIKRQRASSCSAHRASRTRQSLGEVRSQAEPAERVTRIKFAARIAHQPAGPCTPL